MAVNDLYRLTCVWSATSEAPQAINQFHFRQNAGLVFDTPGEDLVAAFRAYCEENYTWLVTEGLELFTYKVSKAPDFQTEHIEEISAGVNGLITGDPLPPRTSGLISLRTAVLTRRGRGRIFLPPAAESVSTAGRASSNYIIAMDTFMENMVTDMNSVSIDYAPWGLEVWSEAEQEGNPVTQWLSRVKWSSQRDRTNLY